MNFQFLRYGLAVLIVLVSALPIAGGASGEERPKIEIVPNIAHGSIIEGIAFSPDGARVLSGGIDKNMKLWDVTTGKLVRTFEDTDMVNAVAFSPDGSRVLSGGSFGAIKVRHAATGKLLFSFKLRFTSLYAAVFSPDGTRILAAGGGENVLTLWNAATGEFLSTVGKHPKAIKSAAFSPDGTRVLSGSEDKTMKLWDAASGKLLFSFAHAGEVNSVAFSSDGARVLSGSEDKTMKLWDAATGKLLHTFATEESVPPAKKSSSGNKKSEGRVNAVIFSPDGAFVFSGGSRGIKQWDAVSGQLLHTFTTDDEDIIQSLAFSPDGTHLLSAGIGGMLTLWDAANGQVLHTFSGHSARVGSVAFSPADSRLLSASKDSLRLWDAVNGQLLRRFEGQKPAAFSPDGTRIISGNFDNSLKLWDVASGQLLRTFEGHTGSVYAVAFSPKGDRLISGSNDRTLKLWDAGTGKLLRTFNGRTGSIEAVAFSPDGSQVLSGGDNTLRLWDVASGKLRRTMKGHESFVRAVAFSPDGSTILSGSWDATLKLWDAATGKLLRTFGKSNKPHDISEYMNVDTIAFEGYVYAVAFSPDGTRVVSGSDKTVKLWDTQSGELLHTFTGHSDNVQSVTFSPDGRHLLSGGEDGRTIVWDIASKTQLASLFGAPNDEWLAMTPAGFFANSAKGADVLSIVRGVETFSVMQFYDHLHRPDLVEEALKGDPEGKYRDAASRLNLETILGSGPAPRIELLPNRTEKTGNNVKLAVRIIDASGGIGKKVIWRVNGTTQGDTTAPGLGSQPYPGQYVIMPQTLTVDPEKKNEVEIIAYNAKGLLATPPYRFSIDPFGVTKEERPRLFVLAVGVNDYLKPDWRLRYAANDATALGSALKAVGSPLFADIEVVTLINKDATERGIGAAFEHLAATIKPRDVFILYLGGHGRSIASAGWFFVPQDLDLQAHQTIEANGIGQDKWQRWLAKVVAAKSVVILDACEAGASEAFRGGERERETVMSQLEYATGRNIIAATPNGKAAYEGYRGHGVLTYAVLDALNRPEGAAEETVDVYGLAAHVSRQVMEISQREFGVRQKPEPILHDNFALGVRRHVLDVAETGGTGAATGPTHIVTRLVQARQKPADDAPASQELKKNTLVTVKKKEGSWALIERNGETIGYVPVNALDEVN